MGCCASETSQTAGNRSIESGDLARKDPKSAKEMGSKIKSSVAAKPAALSRKDQYKGKQPIVLGYWKIRGLAQPIRYLLEFIEHPWEDKTYE